MLDIDSLPIGVKPTNQMDFEELIEEKLKIADQLDKEQLELSKKSKVKKKLPAKPTAEPIDEDVPDESDPQIEISIDDEEEAEDEPELEPVESKPKPRPFLKRGEGLKRYQPPSKKSADPVKKSLLNRKSVSTSNINSKPKQTSQSGAKVRTLSKNAVKPAEKPKKPEIKAQASAKAKASTAPKLEVKKNEPKSVEKPVENKFNLEKECHSDQEEFDSNYFKSKVVQSSNNYTDPNDTELKEFENLEKYVEEHPSFQTSIIKNFASEPELDHSESNNLYTNMYQNERENLKKNFYSNFDDSDLEEFMDKRDRGCDQDLDDLDSSSRTLENENKNHNTSNSSSVLSRKIKRISSTNKLSNSNDFLSNFINEKNYICGNYENDDSDNYETSIKYSQVENEPTNFDNYRNYKSSFESWEPEKKVKFDDSSTWLDQPGQNDDRFKTADEYEEQEPAPVSKLINKLFPSIREQEENQKQALIKQQMQKDQEVFERMRQEQMKSVVESQKSTASNINANVLREKINQLETEIELFKKKNADLNKLREKLDTETKLAETNRKLFDKQKQEEIARLKEIHDEEMRKLKQEKKIFEQYKQSVKDRPDRKEREEIDKLNKQIMEMSEEMKTRETRWIANNNRLKERIDLLEKEKLELKKEIQLFEKQRIESLIKMSNQSVQPRSESPNLYSSAQKSNNQKNLNKNLTINTNNFDSDYFPSQHSHYPNLKRTTSEKSLPNSSPTSSSSSIGSTSSLATNSNTNFNQPQPNIIQQSYRPHTINSPLTSNSFDSAKSDVRIQNHKSYSPQQPNLVKSVKFNSEQLKETRYYSPNGNKLIENEEYDTNYESKSLPVNMSNTSTNTYRPQVQGHLTNESDYVISSVTGTDRKLKVKEIRVVQGKHTEKILEDNTLLTIFPNGTVKEVSDDKMKILVKFFNGDRKEVNHATGTETYSYAETRITQIIYSNGLEILKFPNGQIEKHHVDKTKEIIFPDKICKFIKPDGSEETRLPNGTLIKLDKNGDKVIEYPNKQREIHTKDFKKREYPDGSVKTVYTNGLSETKYSNGRVRLKDSLGNIISDTKP